MIKISAKIRYAVRTLLEIGKRKEKITCLSEVEKSQNISAKFAKQILQPLEKADLVGSKRGIHGGYYLIKEPSEIYLIDIFNAFNESIKIIPCINHPDICERVNYCGAKILWQKLDKNINQFLNETTIQDMINEEKV